MIFFSFFSLAAKFSTAASCFSRINEQVVGCQREKSSSVGGTALAVSEVTLALTSDGVFPEATEKAQHTIPQQGTTPSSGI